jgi:hypothetical protein
MYLLTPIRRNDFGQLSIKNRNITSSSTERLKGQNEKGKENNLDLKIFRRFVRSKTLMPAKKVAGYIC